MLVIRIWATIKMFLLERYVFIVNSKMYLFFHPHNSNKPVVYCCYFEMQSQHVAEVLLKESCATAVLLSNFRIKISSHLTSTTYIWPDLSFLLTLPRSFCPSNTQQTKQSKITAADEYTKEWVESFLDLLFIMIGLCCEFNLNLSEQRLNGGQNVKFYFDKNPYKSFHRKICFEC